MMMGIVAAVICGPSVLLSSDCCPFGFYSETSHAASKCPSYDPASAFPGMAEPSDPSSQVALGAGDDEAATTQEESNKNPPQSPRKKSRREPKNSERTENRIKEQK